MWAHIFQQTSYKESKLSRFIGCQISFVCCPLAIGARTSGRKLSENDQRDNSSEIFKSLVEFDTAMQIHYFFLTSRPM